MVVKHRFHYIEKLIRKTNGISEVPIMYQKFTWVSCTDHNFVMNDVKSPFWKIARVLWCRDVLSTSSLIL